MTQLTHGSLFAGIGGFDLGFERAGIKTVWQVEIDPFCRKVLEKHWPNVQRFSDIRECRDLPWCDIVTGGFPCQPFSQAGLRKGAADSRYLWPEMLRVVRALGPTFIVAENVAGFVGLSDGRFLDEVYTSLEAAAYEILPPLIVPASAFGAGQRRDRVWIIAYSNGVQLRQQPEPESGRRSPAESSGNCANAANATFDRFEAGIQQNREVIAGENRESWMEPAGGCAVLADSESVGRELWQAKGKRPRRPPGGGDAMADPDSEPENGTTVAWEKCNPWAIEPNVGRVAHGVPSRVDRLKGLGNAVVPQIAEWIGRRLVAIADGTAQSRAEFWGLGRKGGNGGHGA